MFKKFFIPAEDSDLTSMAIFVLRLWFGLTMLISHGLGKIANFNNIVATFPDPIGLGQQTTLVLVVLAEVVAALFLVVGFCTRLAALVLVIDMFVAYLMVHKADISGQGGGELAFLYLAGYFTILIAGGGLFSLDTVLFVRNGRAKGNQTADKDLPNASQTSEAMNEGGADFGIGADVRGITEQIYQASRFIFLAGTVGGTRSSSREVHTCIESTLEGAWASLPESAKQEATHIIHSESMIWRIKSNKG